MRARARSASSASRIMAAKLMSRARRRSTTSSQNPSPTICVWCAVRSREAQHGTAQQLAACQHKAPHAPRRVLTRLLLHVNP